MLSASLDDIDRCTSIISHNLFIYLFVYEIIYLFATSFFTMFFRDSLAFCAAEKHITTYWMKFSDLTKNPVITYLLDTQDMKLES